MKKLCAVVLLAVMLVSSAVCLPVRASADFLIGDWSTSDGVSLSFYSNGTFSLSWGFFPSESGRWSAGSGDGDAFTIEMEDSTILSLMSGLYGAGSSNYHFEVLRCNNDNFYLVQVYGDYTAKSSPCKLPFTRKGAKSNFSYEPETDAETAAPEQSTAAPERDSYKIVFQSDDTGPDCEFSHSLEYYLKSTYSWEYSPELAYYLMAIATAAYDETDVLNMFKSLGFDEPYTSHETYVMDKFIESKIRYGVGAKKTADGDTLVLIAIAGTNGDPTRLDGEWRSDGDLGLYQALGGQGYHAGFDQASDYLLEGLNAFLDENGISKYDATFVITGHSRGGAVGNIISCKLGLEKSKLYNYNFACPDVARDYALNWNLLGEHDNIFNIGCNQDPVSLIPGILGDLIGLQFAQWGKYGKSYWFCYDWSDPSLNWVDVSFSAHEMKYYLGYLQNLPPLSELKTYVQMKANTEHLKKIAEDFQESFKKTWRQVLTFYCPVDVTLTDDSGAVIARIADNALAEAAEGVLVLIFGDKKIVITPDDRHLNVELEGTDRGKMMLLMQYFDFPSLEIASEYGADNIELYNGRIIRTEWGGDVLADSVKLTDGETGEEVTADRIDPAELRETETAEEAPAEETDAPAQKKNLLLIISVVVILLAAAGLIVVFAVNRKRNRRK